ncbi:hypothetical protein L7F22_015052 [Adiantum nelumboides]|nr:hypothetical protein [Adiantum nelumboides]
MACNQVLAHCIHVQNPMKGPSDACNLHWDILHDSHSKYSALQVAYVPWSQIDEFLIGECAKEDAPTHFNVHLKKVKQPNALSRPTFESHLAKIGYWYAFGPDDYRGEAPKPNPKRRGQEGKNKSRCQCHFVVFQLYLYPNVARINFIQWNHVDVDDNICHGKNYHGSEKRLQSAPCLSQQMKEWILDMLRKGFNPLQVFAHHIETTERNMMGGSLHTSRDLFLTMRDVLNISCKMEDITFCTSADDATSIHNWVMDNQVHVYFYQPMSSSEDKPFTLGIQRKWQLDIMSK